MCPWGPDLPGRYRGAVVRRVLPADNAGANVVCDLPDGTRFDDLPSDDFDEWRESIDAVTGEVLFWYDGATANGGGYAFWQPVGWPVVCPGLR